MSEENKEVKKEEVKPAEAKVEAKPVEAPKAAEVKTEAAKPAEAKVDTKPADATKAAETAKPEAAKKEEAKAEAKPVVADGTPRAPSQESKDAAAEVRNRQAPRGPRGPRGQGGPGGGQGGPGGGNRRPGGPGGQGGGHGKRRRSDEPEQSEYTEKVVQVRRVTKVVKGGKKLSFRVSVIIGNEKGKVGVGVGKAAEVLIAIKKAISDAKKKIVEISTTGSSISHTVYGIAGGSKVLLKPAGDGTGIIAGGTARIVLELAGVGDILAKSQGSKSSLNVARATIEALQQLRSFKEVAAIRGLSIKEMLF